MPETHDTLLPLLRLVAQSSIAGVLASYLFAWLRSRLPQDAESASALRRFGAQLRILLFTPRYARMTTLALMFVIGGAAQMGIAALTGGDVLAVLDTVTAGLMAFAASQITHGLTLSSAIPDPAALQARLDALNDQEPRV